MPRSLSLAFAAGVFGALINSLAVWAAGRYGLTAALGVGIAPALIPAWLYPRLVWGGLWGLQLLLPLRGPAVMLGIVLSVAPTLFQLLWMFPFHSGYGWLGLELGLLTPVLVWMFNLVWAWSTLAWLHLTGR
ncbi:hypothetical protein AAG565_12965 [Fontimonas sp. SYSU GA230001]|uniref:hypothetical protein n=1 Tax=Fontimonas sp. SYSU GA230001 TaxID=3142450 RepID=UPI0032B5F5FE